MGKILAIEDPSPLRVEPRCPVFDRCGGCQLQHLKQTKQLEMKLEGVLETFERIGHIEVVREQVTAHPFVPGSFADPHPMAYRCKVQYAIEQGPDGVELGFFARGSHDVVWSPQCSIQPAVFDLIRLTAEQLWTEKNLTVYDEKTGHGLLRRLLIRGSYAERSMMLTVVINGDDLPFADELMAAWQAILQDSEWTISSVYLNRHKKRNNRVAGKDWSLLWGDAKLRETLAGLSFDLQPASFFQVNPVMADRLFRRVGEIAQELSPKKIWDLYCGIGTLGLVALSQVEDAHLTGIEIVPQAVQDAKENAKINGLSNAEFITGAAEDHITAEMKKADLAIVDPPRKGCDSQLITAIVAAKIPNLIYVSCHPATLARDLAKLKESYTIQAVDVFDMFPETSHVESLVLLSRV